MAGKTDFSKMSLDKFSSVVKGMSASNADRQNNAITQCDWWTFQLTNPQIIFDDRAFTLVKHYLTSHNIENPVYEDFGNATQFLINTNMIDQDKAELAKIADGNTQRTFTGPITHRKYDSADSMILQERQAALQKLPTDTQEEIDLNSLPLEEFQTLIRAAERAEIVNANRPEAKKQVEAWHLLHPEVANSERNGYLIRMQLRSLGVPEGEESVELVERAANQLLDGGFLTLNKGQLGKQRTAEVARLAKEAVETPGSVFDKTTEEEMENLPLDELRRRADLQLAGRR